VMSLKVGILGASKLSMFTCAPLPEGDAGSG
jgi:hypothetical protein